MRLIQVLLFTGALGIFLVYVRHFRTLFRDRVFMTALTALALLAVAFPGRMTDLASLVGVGRGADLVLYLLTMVSGFLWVLVFARLQRIERTQTEIVRALALLNAQSGDDSEKSPKELPSP